MHWCAKRIGVIKNSKEVRVNSDIQIQLAQGEIAAKVISVKGEK